MKINRHNYEEYFILYMDNELSSEERRMVEDFAELHPDLKDELDTLLHYKLEPDTTVVFQNKEDLLKVNLPDRQAGGETPVSLTNYQEWLLLYTDNELSLQQKEMVEDFAAAHPEVKKELTLLLKTRLQPDAISFNNKETLYKSSAKVRPLFGKWYRAAAAILILALGLTTLVIINNKSDQGQSTAGLKKEPIKTNNPDTPQTGIAAVPAPDENNTTEKKQLEEKNINPVYKQALPEKNNYAVTAVHNQPKQQIQTLPAENKKEQILVDANNSKKPDNNLPKPLYNPNVQKEEQVIAVNETPKKDDNNNILTGNPVTDVTPQTSDFVQASNIEDGNNGKKNKFRGFLRKVTRTFEKRTNIDPTNDGGEILVANFTIRTK